MMTHHTPNLQQGTAPPERVFVRHGYGMVGQGRTELAAQQDLLEKIRQARER